MKTSRSVKKITQVKRDFINAQPDQEELRIFVPETYRSTTSNTSVSIFQSTDNKSKRKAHKSCR